MTIHNEHPFLPPAGARDQIRRFRGRMPAPVTIWTTTATHNEGWTVSSVLVAEGEPAGMLGLLDEDCELADALSAGADRLVVNLLGHRHQYLADAFARCVPAPGGPFRLAEWTTTPWGPKLIDAVGWLGVRVVDILTDRVGWSMLVRGIVEHAEIGDGDALGHLRGSYQ